jgi:hypothetical protein
MRTKGFFYMSVAENRNPGYAAKGCASVLLIEAIK